MNTLTTGAKFKVAGLFRAAYRWMRDEPAPTPAQFAPPAEASPSPPPAPEPTPSAKPPPPAPRATPPAAASQGEAVLLPLQAVIDNLPPELKTKVRQPLVGVQTLPVPFAQVMAQLPQGAVRISFGELRRAAPGVFVAGADSDAVKVALPLGEILSRVNLGKLQRRNDQQMVQVPEEITSPFGAEGKGLTLGASSKPQPAVEPLRSVTPAPRAKPIALNTPHAPTAAGFPPRAVAPAAPVAPAGPFAFRPTPQVSPPRPAQTAPVLHPLAPAVNPVPPPPARSVGGNRQGVVPVQPHFIPAIPAPEAGASPAHSSECLQVPLTSLINAWPQPVRLEIAQMSAVDSSVAFPVEMLEKGLRAGKVSFPWKLVRAWLRPVAPPHVSAQDGAVLEIPLSVIAPLFVARRNLASAGHRKVAVDANIPNLFFNGTPPAPAADGISNAAPVSAPVGAKTPDTNYYVWGDTEDRPQLDSVPGAPAPSTDFSKRFATPNEIVKRAIGLDGVVGAIIALPDGLKVASDVPAELNADTLAAFIPQLFGKVSQAAKELRMGELNNLSFTVGNIPWRIYRVNAVYFAAFGRVGESLPKVQLTTLVAELDRKPKTA